MSARRPWKFTALFGCLLAALLIRPFFLNAGEGRWFVVAALTVVFVAAIGSLSAARWQRGMAAVLGIGCIGYRWSTGFFPLSQPFAWTVAGHVAEILFLAFVIVMLLIAIFRRPTVTFDHIYGAFAGYLLIALLFGIVFSLVELSHPGSFRAQEALRPEWMRPESREWLLSYFSCCTLMTIGYGDITPVQPVARTLSILEGMTGQLYLAVLVAVLVGARVAQGPSTRGD